MLKFNKMLENPDIYKIMDGQYIIGFIGFDEKIGMWRDEFFNRNNIIFRKEHADKIKEVDDFIDKLNGDN